MEERSTDEPPAVREPIPLTRRNEQGNLYTRDDDVEVQVRELLAQAPPIIVARASMADESSDAYLREEVLVYFLREFHAAGDEQTVTQLSQALLERFPPVVKHRLASLGCDEQNQAYRDVVQEIFELIFDLSTDRADFLQVKFKTVLKRRTINAFKRYQERRLHELTGMEGDASEDEESGQFRISNVPGIEMSAENRALMAEALGAIDDPYRTVFLLRHQYGWQIDSDDPADPTISKYFGKSRRTIQNWEARAQEALERWREGRA